MRSYTYLINRGKITYGEKFDPSDLAAEFIPQYESGERIEVSTPWGEKMRGYVGCTTGWKPSFLLLSRCNSSGSPWLLDNRWHIIKIIPGKFRWS